MASAEEPEGLAGEEAEDDLWVSKDQLDTRLKGREKPIVASLLAVFVTIFGVVLLFISFFGSEDTIIRLFLMGVGLTTAAAGIGLWRLRAWAWDLTVIVLLMSLMSVSTPYFLFSFVGVALLIYLLMIREYFT